MTSTIIIDPYCAMNSCTEHVTAKDVIAKINFVIRNLLYKLQKIIAF